MVAPIKLLKNQSSFEYLKLKMEYFVKSVNFTPNFSPSAIPMMFKLCCFDLSLLIIPVDPAPIPMSHPNCNCTVEHSHVSVLHSRLCETICTGYLTIWHCDCVTGYLLIPTLHNGCQASWETLSGVPRGPHEWISPVQYVHMGEISQGVQSMEMMSYFFVFWPLFLAI